MPRLSSPLRFIPVAKLDIQVQAKREKSQSHTSVFVALFEGA